MRAGGGRRGLEVRDLVLVALLASIGGVLSTYVGYLGNLVNHFVGVPFGAGQIAVTPRGNLYPCERLIGGDEEGNPSRLPGTAWPCSVASTTSLPEMAGA